MTCNWNVRVTLAYEKQDVLQKVHPTHIWLLQCRGNHTVSTNCGTLNWEKCNWKEEWSLPETSPIPLCCLVHWVTPPICGYVLNCSFTWLGLWMLGQGKMEDALRRTNLEIQDWTKDSWRAWFLQNAEGTERTTGNVPSTVHAISSTFTPLITASSHATTENESLSFYLFSPYRKRFKNHCKDKPRNYRLTTDPINDRQVIIWDFERQDIFAFRKPRTD